MWRCLFLNKAFFLFWRSISWIEGPQNQRAKCEMALSLHCSHGSSFSSNSQTSIRHDDDGGFGFNFFFGRFLPSHVLYDIGDGATGVFGPRKRGSERRGSRLKASKRWENTLGSDLHDIITLIFLDFWHLLLPCSSFSKERDGDLSVIGKVAFECGDVESGRWGQNWRGTKDPRGENFPATFHLS